MISFTTLGMFARWLALNLCEFYLTGALLSRIKVELSIDGCGLGQPTTMADYMDERQTF